MPIFRSIFAVHEAKDRNVFAFIEAKDRHLFAGVLSKDRLLFADVSVTINAFSLETFMETLDETFCNTKT